MTQDGAPKVKICCIADLDEARLALDAGASALGLVSWMPSGPGVIPDDRIAEIAAGLDADIDTFLLTSRTTADAIAAQHADTRTRTLQLVDWLGPEQLTLLRARCPDVRLVQVIHATDPAALDEALQAAPLVDALLLDSGQPQAAVKILGGTGQTHDWALSRRIRDAVFPLPVWLAGGLKPHNVAEAIATVQPHGLDLCTGVRTDGRLDGVKLMQFMAAVQANSPGGANGPVLRAMRPQHPGPQSADAG
jgi:phosphoribosylanthranilate isomerase